MSTAFQLFHLEDGREARCNVPAADGSTIFTLKAEAPERAIAVRRRRRGPRLDVMSAQYPQVAGVQGGTYADR